MIESSKTHEGVKPHEQFAHFFEQQLERACANGCDKEISESLLSLAALYIVMKEVSNQSNYFTCSNKDLYTIKL